MNPSTVWQGIAAMLAACILTHILTRWGLHETRGEEKLERAAEVKVRLDAGEAAKAYFEGSIKAALAEFQIRLYDHLDARYVSIRSDKVALLQGQISSLEKLINARFDALDCIKGKVRACSVD
jgi:hypothetical protein